MSNPVQFTDMVGYDLTCTGNICDHELAWEHNHEGAMWGRGEWRGRVYSCSGMHQQISMEIRKLGGLGGKLELLLYTANQTLPLFVETVTRLGLGVVVDSTL